MATYRAFIEMTFEPDENGYLEWEVFEEEYDKPRTEDEMLRFFQQEIYDYVSDYSIDLWNAIRVERIK